MLKNIALRYELWTFFRIVHELTVLKGPPVRSGRPTRGPSLPDRCFAAGGTFEWAIGVRLCTTSISPGFAPERKHSDSIPLRPDIELLPCGRKSHLELFEAKFRVHGLRRFGLCFRIGDDERLERERALFKRGDIYKMHAVPDARSWILYPGGEFRFFGVAGSEAKSGHQAVSSPEGLPETVQGVGAIPLAPVVGDKTGGGQREAATSVGSLRETLRRMLGGGSGMSTTLYIL